MNMFPMLVRQRVPLRQAHYLLASAHSGDTGRFLSVTAALNISSVFAAVCSKRTGKDRHLLLTTNAGGGGETQSLSCGGVWGGSIVLIEGGKKQRGCLTTTLIPTGASSSRCWMKQIAVITASWGLPPPTSPRPTSTQDCASCSEFSSSCTFSAGQW